MVSIPVERLAVIFGPLFAGLSTWVVALVADNVPGAPQLDPAQVQWVLVSVFLGHIGLIWKWLHGRQKPELTGTPIAGTLGAFATALRPETGPPGPIGMTGVAGRPPTEEEIDASVRRVIGNTKLAPPTTDLISGS